MHNNPLPAFILVLSLEELLGLRDVTLVQYFKKT